MIRVVLVLTLTGLLTRGTATASDACPAIERTPGPPVDVVLFGYPHSRRAGQSSLTMVDHDLLHMSRFFEALGPRGMWIHGEPEGSLLARFGITGLRAATWRALLGTVSTLVEQMADHAQRPRVYLYFSGHGNRAAGRLELYARAEPGATERGYDGIVDSALIARDIVGPLSAHADVHLLADTCFSYFLLQTRQMRRLSRVKTTLPRPVFDDRFARDFPGVGALLATLGNTAATYENRREGGLFSHAVRSVALGPADLNRDGVLTYGEMDFALAWVSEGSPLLNRPAAVAPGLDPNAVFIDWRASPAARVCASDAGKRAVLDNGSVFATVHLPSSPTPLWLAQGHAFAIAADSTPRVQQTFVARDGPMEITGSATIAETRGELFPAFFPTAVDGTGYDPERPDVDAGLPVQLGAGLTVGGSLTMGDDVWPATAAGVPHVDLSTRVGYHRHRLLLEGSYTHWRIVEVGVDAVGAEPAHIATHALGARAGYGVLVHEGDHEIEVGALGGLHWLRPEGAMVFTAQDAALRMVVLRPRSRRASWAWRFEVQIGAMRLDRWIGPMLRLGVGIDFEVLLSAR